MSSPLVDVSRSAIVAHLRTSFTELERHRDLLLEAEQKRPGEPSVGQRLVDLQRHLIAELRWMRAIAPHVDRAMFASVDGRRHGLKRYANEVVYLAHALHAAAEAGPPSDQLSAEQYDRLWQRVSTGLTRVLALGGQLRS